MALDLIMLQASYMLAYFIRNHGWVYMQREYRNLGILLIFADLLVIVLNNSLHDVIKRTELREAYEHGKHSIMVLAVGEIPWTEEPGRLQSMGSHRVGHD